MTDATPGSEHEVYDVVGVGFGPSNLGLAIALEEHNAAAAPGDRVTARFVERQEKFGWHRGMLLADTTMQVSFLKDLVTLRNPTSSFSFLSYLQARARLVDFINYGSNFPTRLEFHDYLEWAASRLGDRVDYGAEVIEVMPVRDRAAGAVEQVEVVYRHGGATRRVRARNVVLATGLTAGAAARGDGGPADLAQQGPAAQRRGAHRHRAEAPGRDRCRAERRGERRLPAPDVPDGRGLRGVRPLRLQPGRRQLVREPDLRPVRRRRLLRRAGRGQGDDPGLPREHELLGRRPGTDRRALPHALPRARRRQGAAEVLQRLAASPTSSRSPTGSSWPWSP